MSAPIHDHLIALQGAIKTATNSAYDVRLWDGVFSQKGIAQLSLRGGAGIILSATAANIVPVTLQREVAGALGDTPAKHDSAEWRSTARFAAAILAQDAGGENTRQKIAHQMADAIAAQVIKAGGQDIVLQNHYSEALYQQGFLLLSLSWRRALNHAQPDPARFAPSRVSLIGASDSAAPQTIYGDPPAPAFQAVLDIIVIGGAGNNGANLNDVWRAPDGDLTAWQKIYEGDATHVQDYASAVFGGHAYILGGYRGGAQVSNQVWRSVHGEHWERMPDPPWPARYGASVWQRDGWLYLFGGGAAGGGVLSDCWRTQDGAAWEQFAMALHADQRATLFAKVFRLEDQAQPNYGRLFHVGGTGSADGYLQNHNSDQNGPGRFFSDDNGANWQRASDLLFNVGWSPYNGNLLSDDYLAFAGGLSGNSTIATYRRSSSGWGRYTPAAISPRWRGAALTRAGVHHIIAGRNDSGPLGYTNQIYTKSTALNVDDWTQAAAPPWGARGGFYALVRPREVQIAP